MDMTRKNTKDGCVIIGLGNEFMRDDGFGIIALRLLREKILAHDRNAASEENRLLPHLTFRESTTGGLDILDLILGFRNCILLDAVITGSYEPGTLFRHVYNACREDVRLVSSHQINLTEVLGLAKLYHADAPQSVVVYGMEVEDALTFSVGCTKKVQEMLPLFVETVAEELTSGRPFNQSNHNHVAEFPRWPSARIPSADDHPVFAS